MNEQPKSDDDIKKLMAMRMHAVAEATREVLQEQQAEIEKRARAKLAAMGVVLKDKVV